MNHPPSFLLFQASNRSSKAPFNPLEMTLEQPQTSSAPLTPFLPLAGERVADWPSPLGKRRLQILHSLPGLHQLPVAPGLALGGIPRRRAQSSPDLDRSRSRADLLGK